MKKKLTKQQKTIKELEECKNQLVLDIEHLQSELQASFSDREDSEQALKREAYSYKQSLDTALENNRALLEKQERLELESAKQKATLEIRQHEKELLASLVKFHKEQVSASIALTADSYANPERPRRDSE